MTGPFEPPPPLLAWRHRDARDGFEVASIARRPGGDIVVHGTTAAVEDARPWVVDYQIRLDAGWRCIGATVGCRSSHGQRTIRLDTDRHGRWYVDERPQPHLDGCLDIDLEASVLTNAFPVHRAALDQALEWDSPAVYVRVESLMVERLDQTYRRLAPADPYRYAYRAPSLDFACELTYDAAGFVTDYPGLAIRAGGGADDRALP